MTSPALNNRDQSDFGRLLAETFAACQGRSCIVLAEVLRVKVRAWADDQLSAETAALASYDHGRAKPFEGAGR